MFSPVNTETFTVFHLNWPLFFELKFGEGHFFFKLDLGEGFEFLSLYIFSKSQYNFEETLFERFLSFKQIGTLVLNTNSAL